MCVVSKSLFQGINKYISDVHLESCQASKMKVLQIQSFILDVLQGSEYASVFLE